MKEILSIAVISFFLMIASNVIAENLQNEPIKLMYNFEDGTNPFKFWSPPARRHRDFKINHFGIVQKDGEKCLFVDVQFTNTTKRSIKFAYWKLPVRKIVGEGVLNFKYRIMYGPENNAWKSGIGVICEFPEIKPPIKASYWINGHTEARYSHIPPRNVIKNEKIGLWINYDANIVPLCTELSTKDAKKYLGLKHGNAGCIITDLVILLQGHKGQRAQFYLDFVGLYGETPTVDSYLKVLPARVKRFRQDAEKIIASKKEMLLKIQQQADQIYKTAQPPQVKSYAKSLATNTGKTVNFLQKKKTLSPYEQEYLEYEISAFTEALKELKAAENSKFTADNATIYVLDNPVLPFKILPRGVVPGKLTGELNITAAQGEYEPAAIVINPEKDIPKAFIKVSDLKNAQGNVIPAANLKIRNVKCWYQNEGAWFTHQRKSDQKVLVPELLLNDDSIIKVLDDKKTNLLKLNFPDGARYVNPVEVKGVKFTVRPGSSPWSIFTPEAFPFKDSDNFESVSLQAKSNKQFWLTVKVPENAKPGIYNGILTVKSSETEIGKIKIKLNVLPFKLPAPATFDGKSNFISSIYYVGNLFKNFPQGSSTSHVRSLKQLEADYRSMLKHNIYNPTIQQGVRPYIKDGWEMLTEHLRLRQKIIKERSLFASGTIRIGNPEAENIIEKRVAQAVKFKKIASEFGISRLYVQGIDEARGTMLTKQKKIWQALHKQGIKVFSAAYDDAFKLVGNSLDIINYHGKPTPSIVRAWHKHGSRIICYTDPQAGPENPYLFRKGFGFKLWKLNVDGAMTYGYAHSAESPYSDGCGPYREMAMAYPTANGVIETLALVGYREAIDDIRYGTLLKQLIERNRSGPKARIAADAESYLKNLDNYDNLSKIRKKIIQFILKLKK
jgi:hypothetical protein